MTHDELLAKLDAYTICTLPTKAGMVCDNAHLKEMYPEWFALRAVVELHRPMENSPYCEHCCLAGFEYPCFTIQAIEKELNG